MSFHESSFKGLGKDSGGRSSLSPLWGEMTKRVYFLLKLFLFFIDFQFNYLSFERILPLKFP